MPEPVVNPFKVIEIKKHHGEFLLVSVSFAKGLFKSVVE